MPFLGATEGGQITLSMRQVVFCVDHGKQSNTAEIMVCKYKSE